MKNLRNLFRLLLCLLLLIPATVSAENKLALEPFTISAGQTQDLVIDLINDAEITAVEFILTLPEGLTIQPDPEDAEFLNVSLASNRTTTRKHSLDAEVNANGYKVLLASNQNKVITGNSGALIKIGIVAASTFKTGTITVQNIELVSPNETAMHPDPVSVEITLPKVTVTINNAERKYGEDNPQFTFSSSATSDLSSVITLSCDATKTSNVGQYAITGTSTATDFDVEFVNGTLTVNPAVLTVTANAKTKVYGAADPELTYVATGLVNGDQLSGALTRATGDAVGIYAIQVGTLAASTNYSLSFTGADFTITAKAVSSPTITLAESSVVYDGTEKKPAVTVKDGSTEISASEYTVSYSNNINVGTATVTITDNAGGNYTVSGSKTFTITAKSVTAPTITLAESSVVYDGTEKKPAVTVKDGSTVIPASEYTVGYSNNTNVGTATITITDNAGGNYTVSGSQTFDITAKTVTTPTITLAESSVVYDGSEKKPAVTVKDGNTVISASEYTVGYSNNINAGTATITITDNAGGNYTVSGSTSFTITAKSVTTPTITLAESSFVFDGTEKKPAVTVKDGSTEIPASEYTVGYSNNINAGTATITITDNNGGNYAVSGSTSFTITAKSVTAPTITLAESSVVYDGTEKQPAVTVLDGTTTIPASEYTVGYSNNKNVGTATVTITSNAGGNYTVSGSTTFTITKAPLTVKAKDAVRLVGNANPTFEIEYQGFVSGETDAVLTTKPVASTTATADSPVGVYDITVIGGSAANYELSYVKGKLIVADKSSITITAENVSRLYGEANPQFRYTVVGGDGMQGTPELTCEAVPGSPVGTYIIKVNKGSITTDANFIFNDGILTVNRAQLTAISNATRTYGEDNPALTISYTGFVNGETEAVLKTAPTASTTATKSSGAGFYPITVTGGEADNYNIICQNGQLTVNKAALHVYVADVTRTYGEQNPQFTCRYDGFVNGDSQSAVKTAPSLSTEATASSPAGTYSITATGGVADNYDFISVDGWLNVKKAPLTITADDATRNEGADEPEFTYTCSGLVNGDQADNALTTKPTLTTNARKDSPAGTYTITAANAVAQNYDISYVAGTLTVVKLENFVEEKTGATYNVEFGNQVSFAGVSETTETPTTCQVPATVTYEGNTYDVKSIADRAFMGNTVIEEITLPASIERIGASVFAGCTSLRQLVVNILTPLALPTAHARALTAGAVGTVFEGVDLETCVLYVPESSVDLYKAADGWKEFKTILPITSLGIQDYTTTAGQLGDVYDLRGRKVRTAATSLDGLPKGVYIVGGRKVTK